MNLRGPLTRLELLACMFLLVAVGFVAMVLLRDVRSSPERRNDTRSEDVRSLGKAFTLYALEHGGRYPEGVSTEEKMVCQDAAASCTGMLDVRPLIPRYLERIPADPFAVGVHETFYTVRRDGKHIIVAAPYAEGGAVIQVEE